MNLARLYSDGGHRFANGFASSGPSIPGTMFVGKSEMLAGAQGESLLKYWKKQLAAPLPVLNLPTDRPRQPIQTHRGGSYEFTLKDELSPRLKALAKAQATTLYVVLLSSFQAMLH